TVAVGLASEPARATMLAAKKNNSSHLDITRCVQICAVLRMLSDMDPRCSGTRQRRPAWAPSTHWNAESAGQGAGSPSLLLDLRGLALRLAPDFIMAGSTGVSDMKSHADERARASGGWSACKENTDLNYVRFDHVRFANRSRVRRADESSGRRLCPPIPKTVRKLSERESSPDGVLCKGAKLQAASR